MKKMIILFLTVLSVYSTQAQTQNKNLKFMLQSKFKGMYLYINDSVPMASAYYYGSEFFIDRGELIQAYDPKVEEEKVVQLVGENLYLKRPPYLTQEDYQQIQIERMSETPESESKVVLPKLQSQWYFEPAGDGCVYIVCPYEPYAGMVLTITNPLKDYNFKLEFAPRKLTLNDDQKWQFILVP